jgi:hypothetical protein
VSLQRVIWISRADVCAAHYTKYERNVFNNTLLDGKSSSLDVVYIGTTESSEEDEAVNERDNEVLQA